MDEWQDNQMTGEFTPPSGTAGQSVDSSPTVAFEPIRDEAAGNVDTLIKGGVPIPDEVPERAEETIRTPGENAPIRRRRKPVLATMGQKLGVLAMALVLAFSLGILAGVGLSYGSWKDSTQVPETETTGRTESVLAENMIPETQEQTTAPTEAPTEATEATEATEDTKATEPADATQPTEKTTAAEEAQAAQPEPKPTSPPATEPPATEKPANETSYYFFPDSDSRYLTFDDYCGMNHWELILARNEIFARHGRRFVNEDIQEYFNGCSWYSGTISPDDFDSSVLNDYEVYNVYLLKDASEVK